MTTEATPNRLVLDIEIARPLPLDERDRPMFSRAGECGISVIGTQGTTSLAPIPLLMDGTRLPYPQWEDLSWIVSQYEGIVTWNGVSFDHPNIILNYGEWLHDIEGKKQIDLMAIMAMLRDNVPPGEMEFGVIDGWYSETKASFKGLSLTMVGIQNLGVGKPEGMDGAAAPEMWQRGEYGKVISYCLNDVALTRALYRKAWSQGYLLDAEGERVDIPKEVL